MGKQKYESDIVMSELYRDEQTGIEGRVTGIYFYQFSCERVTIERVGQDGKIEDYTFDAPRLVRVSTGERATTDRTGGPGNNREAPRSAPPRR